jgi:hypothetical protein
MASKIKVSCRLGQPSASVNEPAGTVITLGPIFESEVNNAVYTSPEPVNPLNTPPVTSMSDA